MVIIGPCGHCSPSKAGTHLISQSDERLGWSERVDFKENLHKVLRHYQMLLVGIEPRTTVLRIRVFNHLAMTLYCVQLIV